MLGKTLALASTSRIATLPGERARELEERIDFARDIHDGVVQRLFGVSLALSSEQPLTRRGARALRAPRSRAALGELRSALQRPLGRSSPPTGTTLAAELDRLRAEHPDLGLCVEGAVVDVPAALEPLAQSVLTEAVRNARKHADAHAPRRAHAHRARARSSLEIENDGVPRSAARVTGVGLRLAALEALQSGGLVEFGERAPGTWQSCGSSCRCPEATAARERAPTPIACACSSSTTTTSCTGAFGSMLGELDWVERCLSARTGDEALALTREHAPDVALVDLFLGEESGPEVCERLLTERPELRVLLISGAGRISPATARACGASGFVPKDWPAADVARAVRMVALGMALFEPAADAASGALTLSGREREVLERIAGGATNREIALRAAPLAAHGQGAHERAVSQARRAQPRRGRAARAAPRPAGLTGQRPLDGSTPHVGGKHW